MELSGGDWDSDEFQERGENWVVMATSGCVKVGMLVKAKGDSKSVSMATCDNMGPFEEAGRDCVVMVTSFERTAGKRERTLTNSS